MPATQGRIGHRSTKLQPSRPAASRCTPLRPSLAMPSSPLRSAALLAALRRGPGAGRGRARVHVGGQRARLHLERGHAAQAQQHAALRLADLAGVGGDDKIGAQQRAVPAQQVGEPWAADLLLALHEDLRGGQGWGPCRQPARAGAAPQARRRALWRAGAARAARTGGMPQRTAPVVSVRADGHGHACGACCKGSMTQARRAAPARQTRRRQAAACALPARHTRRARARGRRRRALTFTGSRPAPCRHASSAASAVTRPPLSSWRAAAAAPGQARAAPARRALCEAAGPAEAHAGGAG